MPYDVGRGVHALVRTQTAAAFALSSQTDGIEQKCQRHEPYTAKRIIRLSRPDGRSDSGRRRRLAVASDAVRHPVASPAADP